MPRATPAPPPEHCPTLPAEHRASTRHPCVPPRGVRYATRPSFGSDWALLRDLSAGGAGLMVFRPLRRGTVILLELADSAAGPGCRRRAVVGHAHPGPNGSWLVGCRFTPPLDEAELTALRQELGGQR